MKLAVQVNNYEEYMTVINYYRVFEDYRMTGGAIIKEDWYNRYRPLYVCIGNIIHIKGFRNHDPKTGSELTKEYNKISYVRWMIQSQ